MADPSVDAQVEQRVAVGFIKPMRFDEMMNVGVAVDEHGQRLEPRPEDAPAEEMRTITVPIPAEGVTPIRVESHDPLVLAPETLDFALDVAERVTSPERLASMPHSQQAAELLALAYAVRHYHRKQGA